MSALAQTLDRDYYTRAANEDDINGGPWTRTKYSYAYNNPLRYTDPSGLCGPLTPLCIALVEYGPELAVGAEAAAAIATGTPSPVSNTASFTGRAAQELTHDVYLGISNGEPAYVGITNNFSRRVSEWTGTYRLEKLNSCPVTKDQARGIEQALINNNPQFQNQINSIAPTRPWYSEAVQWGQQWLTEHGF